jgi:hypothetical protein
MGPLFLGPGTPVTSRVLVIVNTRERSVPSGPWLLGSGQGKGHGNRQRPVGQELAMTVFPPLLSKRQTPLPHRGGGRLHLHLPRQPGCVHSHE